MKQTLELRERIRQAADRTTYVQSLADLPVHSRARNAICGDQIAIQISPSGKRLGDVQGCLVARATWNLLAEAFALATNEEALKRLQAFRRELKKPEGQGEASLSQELSLLLGFRSPSPRLACVDLVAQALEEALHSRLDVGSVCTSR